MGSAALSDTTVTPSELVNPRNHGAIVTVAAALCIVFSLLFCVARLVVRWPWKRLLGRDDIVAGAALVGQLESFFCFHTDTCEVLLDSAIDHSMCGCPSGFGENEGRLVTRGDS